jgi:hypothetical protein
MNFVCCDALLNEVQYENSPTTDVSPDKPRLCKRQANNNLEQLLSLPPPHCCRRDTDTVHRDNSRPSLQQRYGNCDILWVCMRVLFEMSGGKARSGNDLKEVVGCCLFC